MSQENNSNQVDTEIAWQQCKAGTLGSFRRSQRRADARMKILKAAGAGASVACLLVALVAAYQLPWSAQNGNSVADANQANSPFQTRLVALSCKEVSGAIASFFDQDLAPEKLESTMEHLRKCPSCRKKYEREAKRRGEVLELAMMAPNLIAPQLLLPNILALSSPDQSLFR